MKSSKPKDGQLDLFKKNSENNRLTAKSRDLYLKDIDVNDLLPPEYQDKPLKTNNSSNNK